MSYLGVYIISLPCMVFCITATINVINVPICLVVVLVSHLLC